MAKESFVCMLKAFSEKYPGLPTAAGSLTSDVFEYITNLWVAVSMGGRQN
jgi:hypothetical protein